jgi:hypothetical protein
MIGLERGLKKARFHAKPQSRKAANAQRRLLVESVSDPHDISGEPVADASRAAPVFQFARQDQFIDRLQHARPQSGMHSIGTRYAASTICFASFVLSHANVDNPSFLLFFSGFASLREILPFVCSLASNIQLII